MTKNQDIQFYVDSLITEIIVSDRFVKNAQSLDLSSMFSSVRDFFKGMFTDNKPEFTASEKIEPSTADNVTKFLSFIAPGAIMVTFSRMGLGWIGLLLGAGASMFSVDLEKIMGDIYAYISTALHTGEKIPPEKIESVVQNAVQAQAGQPVQPVTASSLNLHLRQAQIIKVALEDYKKNSMHSYANTPKLPMLSKIGKGGFLSILTTVLSWFFKASLWSVGFSILTPIAANLLGVKQENASATPATDALRRRMQLGTGKGETATTGLLPVSPEYTAKGRDNIWAEKYIADEKEIRNMLLDFTNEVYPTLSENEYEIRKSTAFNQVAHAIAFWNRQNLGSSFTFIPDKIGRKNIFTKKDLVDLFLPDVLLTISKLKNQPKQPEYYDTYVNAPSENVEYESNPTQPVFYSAPVTKPTNYPVVISDKWKSRLNSQQQALLSRLTPQEQQKVEEYLNSLSFMDLIRLNNLSSEEKITMFKEKVKEELGEDAYRRVSA